MSRGRRQAEHRMEIWPGYVDAFSTLIMVVVLVLIILVISQFVISEALSKRNTAYGELSSKLNLLSQMLKSETTEKETLKKQLAVDRGKLADKQIDLDLQKTKQKEIEAKVDELLAQLSGLNQALEVSKTTISEKELEIGTLTTRLNKAMAEKVEELRLYRSEFLGRLRKALGERKNIKIVGDRFIFQSEVLFPSGSAELQPGGKLELTKLASDIKSIASSIPQDLDWVLEIQGHTDRRPIKSALFKSNWELSIARALSVVRFFISQGIEPTRLAASGYAEFQPLDPGKTEEAYAKNRRIELKLSQKTTSRAEAE